MSIPVPNLDDRNFADLVAAARERIRQVDPEWTDLSVHDPGIVILEAFAFVTETLLYRVNRVPEKLYAVFLNLIGTSLHPPSTAETLLEFSRATPGTEEIQIPRGTQVGCPAGVPGAPQPVFTTTAAAVIASGSASVLVPAADVTLYDAVRIGVGTGRPGQNFEIPNAPVVSGAGLAIAMEVPEGTRLASGAAVLVEGKRFRYCREVEAFADAEPGEAAVKIDRSAGVAMFPWWDGADAGSPGLIVPAAGAEVRAWYRAGGGERGNVAAGQLTVLRTPVPGVRVTNPDPATGGRDGESVENALRRAPQDFQARERAVTVRDYEVLATRHGGVARARAFTRRDLWGFARPGEVEVVLVPFVPGHGPAGQDTDPDRVPVQAEELQAHARDQVRTEVEAYLRRRSTVGAEPVVRWGLYKQVLVDARVVVRSDEDPGAVKARIIGRLSAAISPLTVGGSGYGSGFGRPLRVSNLYRAMEEAEPGVQYVDRVRLEVDKVPDSDAVGLVQADGQARTWFVAQQGTLFRTTNAADGWEACAEFGDIAGSEGGSGEPSETIRSVAPFRSPAPGRLGPEKYPGMVAVATAKADGSRIYVSEDLGESWRRAAELGFGVVDLCWVDRQGTPVLLLAGEHGLYELPMGAGAVPVQNLVDAAQPDRGFYAVEAFVDVRGRTAVVVAAQASAGIWLSPEAGAAGSFTQIKAAGEDIRCMAIQYDGASTHIWLGRSTPEGSGTGCLRLKIDELARTQLESLAGSWEEYRAGWTGGSCWSVHVAGNATYAATQSGGVLRLQLDEAAAQWSVPDVNCGLPLRDRTRFEPVRSVSGAVLTGSGASDGGTTVILAAGPKGVFRSTDLTGSWQSCSRRVVEDVVTLPETWLFCSGQHRIEVVHSHG
ncbi:baseplate J/gp47 family protein [Pseudarthrobacter sp. J75]|uniref:baseplate J/gp47 family protein n=1 Tax=unclassified Pseudarthrobacter TaxID=2647000 RepID=UPI002E8195CD|nr:MULTISPECIES: baseplate J/gp47 family protein [unclassified Pseudarthrobacter]MEE2524076.1 baseplate J/gp47 family protein [Pseudarthrobacter sp. J47]MEE2530355.1 baseplate J/gp47 family protein [Pseudarthrobacter sp. J75]